MRKNILLLLLPLLLACSNSKPKKTESEQVNQISTLAKDQKKKNTVEKLMPLTEGEVELSDEDFGSLIELKGTSHPVDHIFKVSESEMMIQNDLLIMKNLRNLQVINIYRLPDFKRIKSLGKFGGGPGEFQYPNLVKDESEEHLCFIYEGTNNHIYALTKDLVIKELPIDVAKGRRKINDKQLYGISSDHFVYVESIKRGKAIFDVKYQKDSTSTRQLKKLAFSDQYKNWAAYIGDFGANGKKNRLVYAYKYFKRLVFYDTENQTSKVISFASTAKASKGGVKSFLSPATVTHYWGMSSNDQHVYVFYSGRTPIQVHNELKKTSGYIYVEKYDWNGNPVARYKLNQWGYFCVDKKENTIYLISTEAEHPFISFKIP